jgi:hypothetical protein
MASDRDDMKLPPMPDLRFHPEFRRGYAECLSDVQKLSASPTGEAEPRVTPAMVEHQQKMAADAESIGKNLDAIRGQLAATPAAPGEVTDAQLAKAALKGFDDYWTEDSNGVDEEAWLSSAKAVLALSHPAPVAAPAPASEAEITASQIKQEQPTCTNGTPNTSKPPPDAAGRGATQTHANGSPERAGQDSHTQEGGSPEFSDAVAAQRKWVEGHNERVTTHMSASGFVYPPLPAHHDSAAGQNLFTAEEMYEYAEDAFAHQAKFATPTPGDSADAPVQQAGEPK